MSGTPMMEATEPAATEPAADLNPPRTQAWWRACRYEVRNLGALRSTWIVLGVIAALALWVPVAAPFVATAKDLTDPSLVESVQWSPSLTQMPALGFFLMVLATGPVSAELTRGAARTSWLTAASRSYAFWAKSAVGAAIGAVVSVLTALLEVGGLALVAVAEGFPQPLWVRLLAAALRLALWTACWMTLCTAVSALLRNRVGPVLVLFLAAPAGERLLAAGLARIPGPHLSAVADWLPFAAGRTMLSEGATAQGLLGGAVFVAFTAAVAVAGHAVYGRRTG
ncbi:hypothetical protein [Streptomyces sp. NPDC005435]|uniref:hypothetical protein n=1 Tax=Streptomyces sp. NPDC005435 TaxID=3154464 RepID=UPI0034542574